MTRQDFVERWRGRSAELSRIGALVQGAQLIDDLLHDFAILCQDEDDAVLTLDDAATQTGYSTDHLRRLVRVGRLAAHRRGRRLLFRAGDLPKKPARIAAQAPSVYDPVADALRVATRHH